MKKLLTTLTLTFGLLFGSIVAISPASADDHLIACSEVVNLAEFTGECQQAEDDMIPCSEVVNRAEFTGVCESSESGTPEPTPPTTCAADQTVGEYRSQLVAAQAHVVALTAKADRLQAVADRRAKTIQRLRAKIRKLR